MTSHDPIKPEAPVTQTDSKVELIFVYLLFLIYEV